MSKVKKMTAVLLSVIMLVCVFNIPIYALRPTFSNPINLYDDDMYKISKEDKTVTSTVTQNTPIGKQLVYDDFAYQIYKYTKIERTKIYKKGEKGYETNDKVISESECFEIKEYFGNSTNVTLPSTINGRPIIAVGYIRGLEEVENLVIPDTVEKIKVSAQ